MSLISGDYLIGALVLAGLGVLAWNAALQWQIHQTRKKMKAVFAGAKAADLEWVIFEQIKRLRKSEKNYEALLDFCRRLEKMAERSVQKVGVVRFNPFHNTGSDQSFCVCLLDAKDNGFILSSLFTREGNRVYTKPIENGISKYQLSGEEKKAIEEARR